MNLILVDRNKEVVHAWEQAFAGIEEVQVIQDSIFTVNCDAIVSPANSFGFMDGGLDRLLLERFGWEVQDELQKTIRDKYQGKLLIGQAELIEIYDPQVPFIISAPTMRVPMKLPAESINPYLSSKAVFTLWKYGKTSDLLPLQECILKIAMPGLGTGIGAMPPEISARQIRIAYDEVFLGQAVFPTSWQEAQSRHLALYSDDKSDLQV